MMSGCTVGKGSGQRGETRPKKKVGCDSRIPLFLEDFKPASNEEINKSAWTVALA
jgi:hypothetical protein